MTAIIEVPKNQNLKGSGLFKLLLIIFGIGKLMTPEGREFLKKIKERLFSKKEESVPNWKESKTKHHDKTNYRLVKQENEEYGSNYSAANKRY